MQQTKRPPYRVGDIVTALHGSRTGGTVLSPGTVAKVEATDGNEWRVTVEIAGEDPKSYTVGASGRHDYLERVVWEEVGRMAYIRNEMRAPSLNWLVRYAIRDMPVGGGAVDIFRRFTNGYDAMVSAEAKRVTGVS